MALLTKFDSLFFGLDVVSHEQRILDMGMTFDASHVLKVACLVGKPIVFGNDVGFFTSADQFKLIDVVVAAETDIVVVCYNFIDDGVVTGADLVSVWFVTGPAVEVTAMFGGMCT